MSAPWRESPTPGTLGADHRGAYDGRDRGRGDHQLGHHRHPELAQTRLRRPGDIPIVAVVDADMMSGMPAWLKVATGMDALTHAIEGYTPWVPGR
jgi:hypothetical protein